MTTKNGFMSIPDFMIILRYVGKNAQTKLLDIHYGTGITYSHVFNIVNMLEKKKLVTTEKRGSGRCASITDIGKLVCDNIDTMLLQFSIPYDESRKDRIIETMQAGEMCASKINIDRIQQCR